MIEPRGLGYKPGKPDPRDRRAMARLGGQDIATQVDLDALVGAVIDQGQLSSCTANGWAETIVADLRRQGVVDPLLPSRLGIYYLERAIEGTVDTDAGAEVRSGGKATAKWGFAPEDDWPYSDQSVDTPLVKAPFKMSPPWTFFRDAIDLRDAAGPAHEYEAIVEVGGDRITAVRKALSAGHVVVFGTMVSEDFCRGVLDPVAEKPPLDKPLAGGHCMVLTGYDTQQRFRVRNSWGEEFGERGSVWFSADYVAASFTGDLWITRVVPKYIEAMQALRARRAVVS